MNMSFSGAVPRDRDFCLDFLSNSQNCKCDIIIDQPLLGCNTNFCIPIYTQGSPYFIKMSYSWAVPQDRLKNLYHWSKLQI